MKNQKFNLLLKPNLTKVMLLRQLMLLLLHQLVDLVQAIFLDSLGLKICPLNILQLNDDELVSLEKEWVPCCIICHPIALGAHVLGSKIQGRKGLILYKTENGTSAMKNHYEGEHSNIWKVYVNEITLNCYVGIDPSKKQSSKVQKVVTQDPFPHFSVVLHLTKKSQQRT